MVGSSLGRLQGPQHRKNVRRDVGIICADRKSESANKIRARRLGQN